jgi:hypothetical protein
LIDVAEDAAVGAVELIVAHGKEIFGPDFHGHVAVEEFWRDATVVVEDLDGDFVVHVAAVWRAVLCHGHSLAPGIEIGGFGDWVFGIVEGVDHFEMAIGGGDALAVRNDVLIVADLDFLTG